MTTQIAVRLEDDKLAFLDRQVRAGVAANRADVVRLAIARLQRRERAEQDLAIIAAHPYAEFDDLHEAASRNPPNLD